MYCRRCGGQIADGNNFCQYCGMPLDDANAGQNQQQGTQNQQQSYGYRQPNYQNYYNYYPYNYPYQQPVPGKGYGIASLVLGICSIPLFELSLVGLIISIIGLCLGISSSRSAKSVGMTNGIATAGIVCSSIGLGINGAIVLFVMLMVFVALIAMI